MIWILKIDCFSLVRQLRNRENTGFTDADAYIYVSELYVLVMNFLWGENYVARAHKIIMSLADDFNIIRFQLKLTTYCISRAHEKYTIPCAPPIISCTRQTISCTRHI